MKPKTRAKSLRAWLVFNDEQEKHKHHYIYFTRSKPITDSDWTVTRVEVRPVKRK